MISINKELLKVATDANMGYVYARRDFQNVSKEIKDKKDVMVVSPFTLRTIYDNNRATRATGAIFVGEPSRLYSTYPERLAIIHKWAEWLHEVLSKKLCAVGLEVTELSTTEIVNDLDLNLDGARGEIIIDIYD